MLKYEIVNLVTQQISYHSWIFILTVIAYPEWDHDDLLLQL